MLPPVGMWVPPVFEPLQTFLSRSLDFITDQLGVLHLCEEALVLPPIGGGVPSAGPGPLDDLNIETPALHLEPMLGSNSMVSNVYVVLYSLFNTFHRLSGGTPLTPLRLLCDRFPYGFTSSGDVYARGLRRMLMLPLSHPNSWGWRATLLPPFTAS